MHVILHMIQSFLQELAGPVEVEKVRPQELSLSDLDYEGSDNTHSTSINYKCINIKWLRVLRVNIIYKLLYNINLTLYIF